MKTEQAKKPGVTRQARSKDGAAGPRATDSGPAAGGAAAGTVLQVPVGSILPSPYQHRAEETPEELAGLADSIRANGILQPLVALAARADAASGPTYELIFGHRRLAAARLAGLKTVPVVVSAMSDAQARVANVVENLQRKDLSPLDEADGVAALTDDGGLTAPQIAKTLGVSERWVFRRRKLASIIAPWRDLIREKKAGQVFCERLSALPAPLQKRLLKTDLAADLDPSNLRNRLWDAGSRAVGDLPWSKEHPEWCEGCDTAVSNRADDGGAISDRHQPDCTLCGDPVCLDRRSRNWVNECARKAMDAMHAAGMKAVATKRVKNKWSAPYDRKDRMQGKYTIAYLVTDGPDAGMVVWAKPEPTPEELAERNTPKPEILERVDSYNRVCAIRALAGGRARCRCSDTWRALELALLYLTGWAPATEDGRPPSRAERFALAQGMKHGDLSRLVASTVGHFLGHGYIDRHKYVTRPEDPEDYAGEAELIARAYAIGEAEINEEIRRAIEED